LNTITQKALAWSVHIFTSLGLLSAFMALIAIDQNDWKACFLWLFVSFIIDSLDGSFARKCRVEEVLPNMDGKAIDYVIDFSTYAIIPAYFFYKAQMVSPTLMPIAIIAILISSAMYYGKKNMVEDGQYFMGFPVLWNFVVFFQFFVLQNNQLVNFISVLILALLHFAPLRFAYPSRSRQYFVLHLVVSVIGLAGASMVLYLYPQRSDLMEWATILGGLYFSCFVIIDTFTRNQS
jgi:phosphatidylcholine synthase